MFTSEEIIELEIDFFKLLNIKLAVARYEDNKVLFIIKIPKNTTQVNRSYISALSDNNNFELNIVYLNNEIFEYNNYDYARNLKKTNLCIFTANM